MVFTLENLNTAVDHPGVPFATAADTLELVAAVGSPVLRMNLDLHHAEIGEGNLIELVRRAHRLGLIGEIQVADVPGRCEPGTGEINYPAVARARALAPADPGRRSRRRRPDGLLPRRDPGPPSARRPACRRRGSGSRCGTAPRRPARLPHGVRRDRRAVRGPADRRGGARDTGTHPRRTRRGGGRGGQGGLLREAHGRHPRRGRPRHRGRRRRGSAPPGGLQPPVRTPASGPRTTRSSTAPSALPSCCARSPATPNSPTRRWSCCGPSSWRPSSTTSTPCATSTPVPPRSRSSPWPTPWSAPTSRTAACSTPQRSPSASTTAPSPPPRPTSRLCTAMTSAVEVFGSGGMLTMGDIRRTHLTSYGPDGIVGECVAYDQDLFHDAYVAELADFTDGVRTGRPPPSPARMPTPPCPSPSPPSSRSPPADPCGSTDSRRSEPAAPVWAPQARAAVSGPSLQRCALRTSNGGLPARGPNRCGPCRAGRTPVPTPPGKGARRSPPLRCGTPAPRSACGPCGTCSACALGGPAGRRDRRHLPRRPLRSCDPGTAGQGFPPVRGIRLPAGVPGRPGRLRHTRRHRRCLRTPRPGR